MRYRLLWGAAASGALLHLLGIGWDVYLHSRDSSLAEREGLLTLGNPSHALIVLGLALTSASLLAMGLAWMDERGVGGSGGGARSIRLAAFPLIAGMAAGSVWVASLAEDSQSHDHAAVVTFDDGHFHDDQQVAAASTSGDSATHAHAASPEAMGEGNAHTHGTETVVTPQQLAGAATFVADVRSNTAKYEDIKAAMADGYLQITQDLPGIAAHFIKQAYVTDTAVMDPAKPEFLLYTKRLDGQWRLVGAMFYGGPGSDPAPSYFGPLDAWHLHENLCFVASGVTAVGSQAECRGVFVRQTNWQLHVWTVEDAEGVFAHDYKKIAPGAFPGATRRADQEFAVRAQ